VTDHNPHQHRRWALRLALAGYLDNVDAFNETSEEIAAADGCWGCLTSCALDLLVDVLEDMHGGDADAVTSWLERELCNELDPLKDHRGERPRGDKETR
jgi:hypothetical protein